jgi:hypothetical protein
MTKTSENDDLMLPFNQELIAALGWEIGDTIEWSVVRDETFITLIRAEVKE